MKQTIRKLLAALCLLSPAPLLSADSTNDLALIPMPQHVQRLDGEFKLTPQTRIYTDRASRETGEYLAEKLRAATGYPLAVSRKWFAGKPVDNAILLTAGVPGANSGAEGYELVVATNAVVIRAPDPAGVFYGAQTLRQLLPPEIYSTNLVPGREWPVPSVEIQDWPRFKWRGLMLDVSRHFFTKAEVETKLDEMALYKLNTFHWHLVDEDGWRIEIKKYPKLTEVGAWRKRAGLMRVEVEPGTNDHPAWMAVSADKFGLDGRYGGFYTQADIREVVAYAAARHIMIVPEIEMPGHSIAALTAYPEYSCFGGPYRTDIDLDIRDGIYDPAKEGTFEFLDNVLAEVFQLFPGPYVHIGGDEVEKSYWLRSPDCQALMKREGLKNGEELQSWFVKRIEKFVNAHGKTMIGWSEILQGGLAKNAVVMDWIGGGKEAASQGHDVVMTPDSACYLDYYQSKNLAGEPKAIGGYLPLETLYALNPIPDGLPAAMQGHVLGAQGNVWTEYIASQAHLDYMIFPRECALAEVVWSSPASHDWNDFQKRLAVDEQRLDQLGVNYRREH
jgi:hexosaminidase